MRTSGALKDVQEIMQKAAEEYRKGQPPSDKYKTPLSKRLARLEKAKTYLVPDILAQFPKKYEDADVQAVLNDLQKEIKAIKRIIGEQKPVVAKGYGRMGLGHDEGYGYGYFY